jgi:hypothetical protein
MNNVTPIESKQTAPAGAKFTISASIDGFPIQVEVEGNADKLRAMIDRLTAIGCEPPSAKPEPTKATGAPVCPVHSATMKVSSAKPGSYFCPKKNEDGSYCKSKA